MVLLSAQDVQVGAGCAGRRPRSHPVRRPGAAVRAGGFAAMMVQTAMTLLFAAPSDAQIPNLGASGAIAAVHVSRRERRRRQVTWPAATPTTQAAAAA